MTDAKESMEKVYRVAKLMEILSEESVRDRLLECVVRIPDHAIKNLEAIRLDASRLQSACTDLISVIMEWKP